MNDAEILGFVPGNYSTHGSLVSCGDMVERLALLDLMDDFLGGCSLGGRRSLDGLAGNDKLLAHNEPCGG